MLFGVCPSLPIKGVSFILGNDLARGRVMAALEVLDHPDPVYCLDELSVSYPDAFPVCVLTHDLSRKENNIPDLSESFIIPVFAETVLPPVQLKT